MKYQDFEKAVDKLVREWATDPEMAQAVGVIPREQLRAIFDEVRNSTAHELAEKQRLLDNAMIKLHKHYTK